MIDSDAGWVSEAATNVTQWFESSKKESKSTKHVVFNNERKCARLYSSQQQLKGFPGAHIPVLIFQLSEKMISVHQFDASKFVYRG